MERIVENVSGALGGLDLSLRKDFLLYTHDVSGYENDSYRRLDSRIFLYNTVTGATIDLSMGKADGTNDLDPSFSPNEAGIIFVNTSNDGISRRNVYEMEISENGSDGRSPMIDDASMPDWE